MKKYLPLIFLPYLVGIDICSFLFSGLFYEFPRIITFSIYLILIIVNIVELFFSIQCIINIAVSVIKNTSDTDLLKKIIYIKFSHIPAYIFIFLIGFVFLTVPLGFIFSLLCFFADCFCIFFTGLPMTIALVAKYKRQEVSKMFTVIHSILAFIFCIDVIDAIYLKVKFR